MQIIIAYGLVHIHMYMFVMDNFAESFGFVLGDIRRGECGGGTVNIIVFGEHLHRCI
jgi:hypothetical protein